MTKKKGDLCYSSISCFLGVPKNDFTDWSFAQVNRLCTI
uniref:Uncharacterized protein n=1 Tax=Rhizophora mucronata TaxID=61149 RepID=A0A2P2QI65_RHIMU